MNIVATEMITLGDISWDMILGGFALFFVWHQVYGRRLEKCRGS